MKNFTKIIFALIALVTIVSCGDKRTRSVQYMPDMYVAVPYEPNGANGLNDNPNGSNLKPVEGTIARGQVPYDYPNTTEGYNAALKELKSPLEDTEANMTNGKKMFGIYCATCHGVKGDGNGVLVQRDKFSGVPNYKDRAITEGSIYHVIMYGRGIMGSHASQLTVKERWQVVHYVEKLRNDLLK
ncbi:Cytochrome c-L [Polaribacter huanghezhanensis]|uniref:c-type cytochrome n=1 Tax=Polaribacter huanghezhanensis TaxID=1354726 RepID=UPI0026485121|nr:cytochrome c [Polaribacter huanghezhanensis]WKD85740.1 Cytochrome c-L [Polaribacter huanghezhanensis]